MGRVPRHLALVRRGEASRAGRGRRGAGARRSRHRTNRADRRRQPRHAHRGPGQEAARPPRARADRHLARRDWRSRLGLAKVPADVAAFAKDVYAFCPDIVDQGRGTVSALQRQIEATPRPLPLVGLRLRSGRGDDPHVPRLSKQPPARQKPPPEQSSSLAQGAGTHSCATSQISWLDEQSPSSRQPVRHSLSMQACPAGQSASLAHTSTSGRQTVQGVPPQSASAQVLPSGQSGAASSQACGTQVSNSAYSPARQWVGPAHGPAPWLHWPGRKHKSSCPPHALPSRHGSPGCGSPPPSSPPPASSPPPPPAPDPPDAESSPHAAVAIARPIASTHKLARVMPAP
ncbi:MAG: DUF4253 domain-containing protein [Polyangiaceae bacterium]|nr:DUF4253 domain-containing protein [Polyangiaceae bacterium]